MQHITELEDDIKSKSKNIQQKRELLRKEKLIIEYQLSLQQIPDNYKYLNDIKLALSSVEKIIGTLAIRYGH